MQPFQQHLAGGGSHAYEQFHIQNGQNHAMLRQQELQLQQQHFHHQFLQQQQQSQLLPQVSANGAPFLNGMMIQQQSWPIMTPEQQLMHSSSPSLSASASFSLPQSYSPHFVGEAGPGNFSMPFPQQFERNLTNTATSGVKGGREKSSSSTKKKARQSKVSEGGARKEGEQSIVDGDNDGDDDDAHHHSESDESIRRAKGLSKRSRTFSNVGGDEAGLVDEDVLHQSNDTTGGGASSASASMNASSAPSGIMTSPKMPFNSQGASSGQNLFSKHQRLFAQSGGKTQQGGGGGGGGGGMSPLLNQQNPFYPQVSATSPHLRVVAQGLMDSPTLLGLSSSSSSSAYPNGDEELMLRQQQMMRKAQLASQQQGGNEEEDGAEGMARIVNVDNLKRGGNGNVHNATQDNIEEETSEARRAKGLSRRYRTYSDASGLNDDDNQGNETGDEEENDDDDDLKRQHPVDDETSALPTVLPRSGLIRGAIPFSSLNIDQQQQQQHDTNGTQHSSGNPLGPEQPFIKHSPHASFGFSPLWHESHAGGTTSAKQAQAHGVFFVEGNGNGNVSRPGPSDFILDGEKAINAAASVEDGQSLLASTLSTSSATQIESSAISQSAPATATTTATAIDKRKHERVNFDTDNATNSSHNEQITSQQGEGEGGGGARGESRPRGGLRKSSLQGRDKDQLALTSQQAADFEISLSHLLNFEDLTEDALATPSSRSESSSVSGEIGRATKKAVAAVFSNTDDININNLIIANEGGVNGGGVGGTEGGGKRSGKGKGGKGLGGKGATSSASAVSATGGGGGSTLEEDKKSSVVVSAAVLNAARLADRETIAQLENKLIHLRGFATHLASEVINLTGKLVKAKWGKAQAERELVLAATIIHSQLVKEEEKKKSKSDAKAEQTANEGAILSTLPQTVSAAPASVASFTSLPGPKIAVLPRVPSDNHLSEASC